MEIGVLVFQTEDLFIQEAFRHLLNYVSNNFPIKCLIHANHLLKFLIYNSNFDRSPIREPKHRGLLEAFKALLVITVPLAKTLKMC